MILLKFLNWPNIFMSESALRRRFKSEVGINITEYVNKRKITIAKVFLEQKCLFLKFQKIRFFDASHFHRIFKSFEGITPKTISNTFQRYHS